MKIVYLESKVLSAAKPFASEEEWLAFRRTGIGASELPCILGHTDSPSVEELIYHKKTGGSIHSSYVERFLFEPAKAAEPEILERTLRSEAFMASLDLDPSQEKTLYVIPQVFLYQDLYAFCGTPKKDSVPLFATIDALVLVPVYSNETSHPIKKDGSVDITKFSINIIETKSPLKQSKNAAIQYASQIMIQKLLARRLLGQASIKTLCASLCRETDYLRVDDLGDYLVDVYGHEMTWVSDSVVDAIEAFALKLLDPEYNPNPKAPVKKEPLGIPLDLELEYIQAEALYDAAKKELENKKKRLLDGLKEGCSYVGHRLDIKQTPVKGRIQYDQIPELMLADLNKYRGKPTYRVSITDKGE
jgi:hypothetical protein